jgi:predicted dehydrogenase
VLADLATVLADPEIDLVDICLPPHLHFSVSEQALNAGKHVICEKPLVRSLHEADRLLALSAASGKQIFPVFQYRYGHALAQLRALQAAGLTGKPFVASLETHWNRNAAITARLGVALGRASLAGPC